MHFNPKGFTRLTILLGILGLVIVAFAIMPFVVFPTSLNDVNNFAVIQPIATTTVSDVSGISQYIDIVNHFSIKYPNMLEIFSIATDTANPDFGRNDPPIVVDLRSIPYDNTAPDEGIADFFIRIENQANCLVTPTNLPGYPSFSYSHVGTTTINGVDFFTYVADSTSVPYSFARFYHTLHGGSCFTLYEFVSANANGFTSYSKQIVPILEQVAQSFTFNQ
jgi:hypothetical protein